MMSEKETKKIKIFNIIGPLLFFIDLFLGIFLLQKDINWWHLKWLWIVEGILISISVFMAIYRCIFIKKEYKSIVYVGFPVLSLILFLNGALVYSGIVYFKNRQDNFNHKRMYEIKEDILKDKNYIDVGFTKTCKKDHCENMDYVAEMIHSMNFSEVGPGVKECVRENVLFSIEVIKNDYSLYLTFYRETPWIYYSLMEGDIFPHTESFYIKGDSVEIDSLYNYINENHDLFHKIEEKNGED